MTLTLHFALRYAKHKIEPQMLNRRKTLSATEADVWRFGHFPVFLSLNLRSQYIVTYASRILTILLLSVF